MDGFQIRYEWCGKEKRRKKNKRKLQHLKKYAIMNEISKTSLDILQYDRLAIRVPCQ